MAVLALFQGSEHQHAGGEVDAIDSQRQRLEEAAADAGQRHAEGPHLAVDMLGLAQKRVTLGSDHVFAVAVRRVEPNAAGRPGQGSRFLRALSGRFPYTLSGKRDTTMSSEGTRTARIEARIAPDALAVVRRAAELQGRSVSDFVVAAAQEAAAHVIEEAQIIRLSVEDQRAIAEAILNPPLLTPAMERAVARHRELISASR